MTQSIDLTYYKSNERIQLPKEVVRLVGATLEYTEIKMKTENRASEPIRINTRLRQGDALSPVLFNLVFEKVVRESNITAII